MIARFHYDRDRLTRFLNDEIDDEASVETAEITSHLESCRECQSTLESLLKEGLTMEDAGEFLRNHPETENDEHFGGGSDDATVLTNFAASFLEPTDLPDSIGRFARYEIMELLGRGGMGIVMRGYDTLLNRHSAIKVLSPELASSAAARKRFSREAKSAAAVVHPHVVPIQTVDEYNGLPYLVMPVVEGQSLDARVRDAGPLPAIEAVRIAMQVAEGLAAAHQQGLVHRDIKPANVLLENGVERVQITDFGLARAIDDASMTRSGVIAGTPQYMSPEQAHGDAIDHRSDLFSLGSLMYFMLTGHSPFRAETTMGVLNRIVNDQPRSIRSIHADVPEWLEKIVMKLLSKSPSDRYQTSDEIADLIGRWHAYLQQPEVNPPPEPLGKPSSPRGPVFTRWIAAAAAAAVLMFAGVLIVLELNKGTLRIECEADDVPIRILRGDDVVDQLTVTQSGQSVRVAAGSYVVEIDGETDAMRVENGTVTLERGETATVKITHSGERGMALAADEAISADDREPNVQASSERKSNVSNPKKGYHKANASEEKDRVLAVLESMHRFANAKDTKGMDELLTDQAVEELAGGMLQTIAIMSALGQISQKTGGVVGEHEGLPVMVPGAMGLKADAFLNDQMLANPPEIAEKAFKRMVEGSLGSILRQQEGAVLMDRELMRLAAGVLKSPRGFVAEAGEHMGDLSDADGEPTAEHVPDWEITVADDTASAVDRNAKVPSRITLAKIDGKWMITSLLADLVLNFAAQDDVSSKETVETPVEVATPSKLPTYGGKDIGGWFAEYRHQVRDHNQGYAREAMQAIEILREHPSNDALVAIELEWRFNEIQNELSPQVVSEAAATIVKFSGKRHRSKATEWLFKIADLRGISKSTGVLEWLVVNPDDSVHVLGELLSDPEWGTETVPTIERFGHEYTNGRSFAIGILSQSGLNGTSALVVLESEARSSNEVMAALAEQAIAAIKKASSSDVHLDKPTERSGP